MRTPDRILPSSPRRDGFRTPIDRSPARPLITAAKFDVKVSLTLDSIFSGIRRLEIRSQPPHAELARFLLQYRKAEYGYVHILCPLEDEALNINLSSSLRS